MSERFTTNVDKLKVQLVYNNKIIAEPSWQQALELSEQITLHVREVEKGRKRLNININGWELNELPLEAATKIATMIYSSAKKAEELDKIQQIIDDQALLIKHNSPLQLTTNPKAIEEAMKRASEI